VVAKSHAHRIGIGRTISTAGGYRKGTPLNASLPGCALGSRLVAVDEYDLVDAGGHPSSDFGQIPGLV
jgi:hypothetical protein